MLFQYKANVDYFSQVPKVKQEPPSSDLSKRPEITITPIPRAISGPPNLSSLQLADLMALNADLNKSLGVSALQDLAKIAERYEKAGEPAFKKMKMEEANRLNGSRKDKIPTSHSVPDLVSADRLLKQMSDPSLLLPAHQSTKSTKTMNAIAALLPQTSIFPAPAAHQQTSKTPTKQQSSMLDSKPEPLFQSLSVYSQSKNIYGKPTIPPRDERSPEIEILDLRIPSESKASSTTSSSSTNNDRLDLELLDLSTRKDITVSAVPKPGPSNNRISASKIPPPQVSIKSTDRRNQKASPTPPPTSNAVTALATAMAAQGMSPQLFNYLVSSGIKQPPTQSPMPPTSQGHPMFPDPNVLNHYYNTVVPQMMSATGHPNATAQAVQQAAAAAQLAQLNSLGLAGLQNLSADTMASLGIYKNYLPQGNLPPPHFLSGLMSPQNPSTSK